MEEEEQEQDGRLRCAGMRGRVCWACCVLHTTPSEFGGNALRAECT